MRRALTMLALAGLVSGCPEPLPTTVLVYWNFVRIIPTGLTGAGTYDYTCAEGGVDYVTITDDLGFQLGTFDCIQVSSAGTPVQGIGILDVPAGPRTFFVTGFRRGTPVGDVVLFQGQGSVGVVAGATVSVDVFADGIPAAITVEPVLPVGYACSSVDFQLTDGIGTPTDAATNIACIGGLPPLIDFTGPYAIDRDNYFISVRAVASPGNVCATSYGFWVLGSLSPVVNVPIPTNVPCL